jgi:hypothetical protein
MDNDSDRSMTLPGIFGPDIAGPSQVEDGLSREERAKFSDDIEAYAVARCSVCGDNFPNTQDRDCATFQKAT